MPTFSGDLDEDIHLHNSEQLRILITCHGSSTHLMIQEEGNKGKRMQNRMGNFKLIMEVLQNVMILIPALPRTSTCLHLCIFQTHTCAQCSTFSRIMDGLLMLLPCPINILMSTDLIPIDYSWQCPQQFYPLCHVSDPAIFTEIRESILMAASPIFIHTLQRTITVGHIKNARTRTNAYLSDDSLADNQPTTRKTNKDNLHLAAPAKSSTDRSEPRRDQTKLPTYRTIVV
ncbi:uncharacterized protein LOC131409233 [Diceros bicornis minor]|uniref:uncharacterized protein LOC131409233 n=1 Tax=Diceros bicornis minor TaxID=77932 RepID=UPI0026EAA527|nr:uncharacterized protein LOC131409233 [Diceros bicornis minor]